MIHTVDSLMYFADAYAQDQYMQGIARVSPIRTQARNAIHAALTEALSVKPEYWKWRKKDDRWGIDQIYRHEVFATTDDSEVRKLYAAHKEGI